MLGRHTRPTPLRVKKQPGLHFHARTTSKDGSDDGPIVDLEKLARKDWWTQRDTITITATTTAAKSPQPTQYISPSFSLFVGSTHLWLTHLEWAVDFTGCRLAPIDTPPQSTTSSGMSALFLPNEQQPHPGKVHPGWSKRNISEKC